MKNGIQSYFDPENLLPEGFLLHKIFYKIKLTYARILLNRPNERKRTWTNTTKRYNRCSAPRYHSRNWPDLWNNCQWFCRCHFVSNYSNRCCKITGKRTCCICTSIQWEWYWPWFGQLFWGHDQKNDKMVELAAQCCCKHVWNYHPGLFWPGHPFILHWIDVQLHQTPFFSHCSRSCPILPKDGFRHPDFFPPTIWLDSTKHQSTQQPTKQWQGHWIRNLQ